MKKLFFFLSVFSSTLYAQSLLDELDTEVQEDTQVHSVFKGLKIINFESTKLVAKEDFYFVIAHRFGTIKDGLTTLFGIDNANIRFSFVYGLSDKWNLGIARSSLGQTYELNTKYELIHQDKKGLPFSLVAYGALGYKGDDVLYAPYPNIEEKHKYNYVLQALISSKLNKKWSVQLSPTFVHNNFVFDDAFSNDDFALGIGGRYKIDNRLSINFDYSLYLNNVDVNFGDKAFDAGPIFSRTDGRYNPLSLGVDIETGGHVFQLHVSNSQAMYEGDFIHANGQWWEGNVFLGFNISRVF